MSKFIMDKDSLVDVPYHEIVKNKIYLTHDFVQDHNVKAGASVYFEMPPFCSGNYTATIFKDERGYYVKKSENYFDSCRTFEVYNDSDSEPLIPEPELAPAPKTLVMANRNIELTDVEREEMIADAESAYAKFMDALRIDWRNDPNSKDTPRRVAKSFVKDLAEGCYTSPPKITAFDNVDKYHGMVFQGNIEVKSICSHHHLPFIGRAHVAYIPGSKVIGLSKLNRIVEWFARRPQVQENLTMQIHNHIDEVCKLNKGVAVMIEADHMCACIRGVKHDSTMITSKLSGAFLSVPETRNEFYKFISRIERKNG